MNAETASQHPSRLAEDAVTPVESRISVISEHWFVFRGSASGSGEYRCGCGLLFLTPDALVDHVRAERGTAIAGATFGTETDPS